MKKIRIILVTALLFVGSAILIPAHSQQITDNAVFYHSIRSPWSNYSNPALFPNESGWYVTTSKTSLQLAFPLSYDNFGLQYDAERDVTILNINNVIDSLKKYGCHFHANTDMNLLGFGFTINDMMHVTASAGLRTYNSFTIPLGFLSLLTEGNINDSNHIVFGSQNIYSTQVYAYASVGAAMKLPLFPLTIGARINILDGISALSIDNLTLDLTTSEDISTVRVSSDYLMHYAGLVPINKKENGDGFSFDVENIKSYIPSNLGFTLDLGAKLKVSIFDISLSLLDIGPGITWKQNAITIIPKQKDVSFSFSGIDLSTLITSGSVDTSFVGRIKDSLLAMIDYTTEEDSYVYSVPARMYVGASASLGKLLRVGYLFQGQLANGWFNNHRSGSNIFACNNTLSAHFNLFNWLELSVVNSIAYNPMREKGYRITPLNPGCALTLSPGRKLQIFAAIEYLSSMNPEKIKEAHFMFGINMVGLKD